MNHRPWFDGRDYEQYLLTYNLDAETRRNEIHQAHVSGGFQTKRAQKESQEKEQKWEAATCFFQCCLKHDRFSVYFPKLCHHFFQLEQHGRFVSRANFARLTNVVRLGSDVLSSLYSSLDPRKTNEIDWRVFAFMLSVAADASVNSRTLLLNAFMGVGGGFFIGKFEESSCQKYDCVRLRDLQLVLDSMLMSQDSAAVVLQCFDEALSNQLAAKSRESKAVTITSDLFERILDDAAVKPLLEEKIMLGSNTIRYSCCIIEYQHYPKALLRLVVNARRDLAIQAYLTDIRMKQKKQCMNEWKYFINRRSHARELVDNICGRLSSGRKETGLRVLRRWALCQVAASEIQRITRGFFGRNHARVCFVHTASSVCLQSCARRYLYRCQFVRLLERRSTAAIEVQRIARGNIHRRIAIQTLIAKVDAERKQLGNAKKRWEESQRRCAAVVIQRVYRSSKSRETTWKRLERELSAMHGMTQEKLRFRRERKVFETELQEYYRKRKAEREAADVRQMQMDHDKIRIRNLQRQLLRDDLNRATKMKLALDAKREQFEEAQYSTDWNSFVEKRGKQHRQNSIRCLRDPRTADDRKIRTALTKRIKSKIREVLKAADDSGIEMEVVEAKEIATKEVLQNVALEEKARVEYNWRIDAMQREEKSDELLKERMRLAVERRKMSEREAALVLTTAYRQWNAKRVLQDLFAKTYKKEFDEETHAFYYRNVLSGEVSWEKPMALGRYDLPTENEWKVLRDEQDFPYYYNPCTLEMSWEPPLGVIMCRAHVPQPWLKEYPVPYGPCEYIVKSDGCVGVADSEERLCRRCCCFRTR